jgi:hypothetical protein
MKRFLLLTILTMISTSIHAQTVKGKVVDQTSVGVPDIQLQLYINPKVYTATSGADGSFTFTDITTVANEQLPTGYSVADNYPNPFNPTTRFEIALPAGASVRADIFNVLGEQVASIGERFFHAGTNFLDVELNGNPNGFYIAHITLDGKYSVVKKMLLLYGSRHLFSAHSTVSSSTQLNKTISGNSTLDVKIDSLVATSGTSVKTVFKTLPPITGSVVDLGNLAITMPGPQPPQLSTPGNGALNQNTATTLSWNASANAASYGLQISTGNAFSTYTYNQNGFSAPGQGITGLHSSTLYYWRVNAANKYGTSAWSDTWSFTTRNNPPSTPTDPYPANNATGMQPSFQPHWTSSDFDGDTVTYDLYFGTNSNPTSLLASNLADRWFTRDGLLSASTTYYWKVVAKDNKGLSANGPVWNFTTVDSSLTFRPYLTITSFTDTTASLSWSDNNNFKEGFLIEQSTDGLTYTQVDSVGVKMTTKSVAGVYQDCIFYSFRIRTFSGYGKSPYSNVVTAGKGVTEFGRLASVEEAVGIATDAPGNLYASMKIGGAGNGIRKYIAGTDSGFSYAPGGGVIEWSGLKIGPGGVLFGARVVRALYTITQNWAPIVWTSTTGSSFTDIDFDNLGNLWAVGNNANIYRFKMSDKSVTTYPFTALLRCVRVYSGYVYVAGKQDSTEGVWRFTLNADGSLGTAEEFFNLSKQSGYGYNGPTANAITFNTAGEMYLGTSAAASILLVTPNGKSFQPLYPGFFQPSTTAFAWGKGGTLFAVSSSGGLSNRILKINTNKTGAPYYGAQ